MLVLLNPGAHYGTGAARWARIEEEVRRRAEAGGDRVTVEPLGGQPLDRILAAASAGETTVIAAGGDGTVHLLANALMTLDAGDRARIALGAVGLGSSNDFHKPVPPGGRIAGIPVRIDAAGARPHNVCEVRYATGDGGERTEHFLINASLGVVADGNYRFNRGGGLVGWLKPRWVDGAILVCAACAAWTYRNFEAELIVDGAPNSTPVASLGLCINPHFTGSLRYDTAVSPESPYFCVNLYSGSGRLDRLRTMAALGRGRFRGRPGARTWEAREVTVIPEAEVPFELDGEVVTAHRVDVRLREGALRVCR